MINVCSALAISESNLTLPLNLYGTSPAMLKVVILSNCGLTLFEDVVGELVLVLVCSEAIAIALFSAFVAFVGSVAVDIFPVLKKAR